jgi:hypothetical protein
MRVLRGCALAAALALLAAPAAEAHHGRQQGVKVVARGLDNPRGLAFGPGGLYVAEAGRGGSGPCQTGPEGDAVCFGTSGAVTRIGLRHGDQTRIVDGLPSRAGTDGSEALGPSDVSFRRWFGYLTIGLGADPALRAQLPAAGAGMATLYRLSPSGHLRTLADLGAFEAANNPAGDQPTDEVDTNPDSVTPGRRGGAVVADAGGNDVLKVSRRGRISVLGVIPFSTTPAPPGIPGVPEGTPLPTQSVPTSVVPAAHGGYYVGQLTGFPFPVGGASVWLVRRGEAPRKVASGFTQITDLAVGRDGSLYVVEIATGSLAGPPTPGALIRVRRNGTREELVAGTLTAPFGLALTRHFAYVSQHSTEAGKGEVVRIPLGAHRHR